VVSQLRARKERLGEASSVDFVASLGDLVPDDQARKRRVLRSIRRTLLRIDPGGLEPELRPGYRELVRLSAAEPFGRDDLPDSVRRQFGGPAPSGGGLVLVFPGVDTDDGGSVRALSAEVRGLELPGGRRVSASGEHMVLATSSTW
jgi:hypothetical protein